MLFTDGGARGNPGPAGTGAVLRDDDNDSGSGGSSGGGAVTAELYRYLGDRLTNNQAEYRALIDGLRLARSMHVTQITVYCDSELLVKQVRGEYRVRNASLRPLYEELLAMVSLFDAFGIAHVRRADNARADALANKAMDTRKHDITYF